MAWLKDQAAEIADFAADPVGDSAALRTSAGAWAAVAEALGRERDSLEGGKPGLAGAWEGPNGNDYLDGVTAASDAMGDIAEQALQVQKLLENGADTIDDLNKQVQLLVVEILATITLTAVITLLTGGGGLALGATRVAAVVTKVKSLVSKARSALLALRVAQVVRLSAIGYKLRKTAELTRAGNLALRGADKAVKLSKSKVVRALNPINTKKKRIVFGSSTASSAISTSLARDPKDWTAEDIARIVAGGYLSAAAGGKLTDILTRKAKPGVKVKPGRKVKLGEVGAATVSSAIFGTTASAGTQAAFNKGRVDWTKAGVSGATSGVGGGIGRASVRGRLKRLDRRLDRPGLSDAQKASIKAQQERLKAAGRLGPEAIGEGLPDRVDGIQDRGKDLKHRVREARADGRLKVPKTPGLDLPKAPVLHTIRPGESLSSIAGDRLDDPDVWRRIREANPGLTDPDLIHPGDRVAIPRDLTFRAAG